MKPKNLTENETKKIAKFYCNSLNTKNQISMREVIKWLNRQAVFESEIYELIGLSLLEPRISLKDTNSRKELQTNLLNSFGRKDFNLIENENYEIITNNNNNEVVFKQGFLQVKFENIKVQNSHLWENNKKPPENFIKYLVKIAFAVKSNEPILLVGPSCFKSLLIETWIQIVNRKNEFHRVYLTPETDGSDLINQIYPHCFSDLLNNLKSIAKIILSYLCNFLKNSNDITMKESYSKLEQLYFELETEINKTLENIFNHQ